MPSTAKPARSQFTPKGYRTAARGAMGYSDRPMGLRLPVLDFAVDPGRAPTVQTTQLDTLWFQLTGTLCNIACRHCFITCGPREDRVPMMETAAVLALLEEAEALGAREYYFTGGEPMLHPDFFALCRAALAKGPLTVLTNG